VEDPEMHDAPASISIVDLEGIVRHLAAVCLICSNESL
jgi:hypothetical protein